MRILHVAPRYYPARGGAETHTAAIATGLAARGHDVTVATTDADEFTYFWNPEKRRLKNPPTSHNGVTIRRFPIEHLPLSPTSYDAIRRGLWLMSRLPLPVQLAQRFATTTPRVPQLARWLRQTTEQFDAVTATNIAYDGLLAGVLQLAQRQRIPSAITPFTHLGAGPAPGQDKMSAFYTMRHQVDWAKQFDAILAMTSVEKQFYVDHGYPAAQVTIASVGITPQQSLLNETSARALLAADTGDEACLSAPIVLSMSTLCFDKGTVHLLETLQRLRQAGSAVRLVLAGPPLADFEAAFAALDGETQARVLRLGRVQGERKQAAFAAATVFAMPSRVDSFGIVYLEAWEHGKPVVGAQAWGVHEGVITPGVDGLTVPFGDVDALTGAIQHLIDDPDRAAELGANGQRKTAAEHHWARKVDAVEATLQRLAAVRESTQ